MMESMVMTVIGKDRPGLVEALSALVDEHDGNWEESRLAGEFAGLGPHPGPGRSGQRPGERPGEPRRGHGGGRAHRGGRDSGRRPFPEARDRRSGSSGNRHRLSAALAAKEVNVQELETEVTSASMSGEPLFQARARLRAPKSLSLDDLEDKLEELAADLMVDVRLDEP